MLEADDEAGADGFGLPRQLDVLEAAHQLPEEGALGAAGEVGAQAEVLADPEAVEISMPGMEILTSGMAPALT